MKPIDETWTAEREQLVHDDGSQTPADWWIVKREPVGFVGSEFDEGRAKLVAAAPDMARLLVEYLQEGSMYPDAVDRALRKAGVR